MEPAPVRQIGAAGQTPPEGSSPGLSLVATIESNGVAASPTLIGSDTEPSSGMTWFVNTPTIGSASTAPMSTVCVVPASAASRTRAKPVPR
jgi:hypothetical protein